MVGRSAPSKLTSSNMDETPALMRLNCCSSCLIPPTIMDRPGMSRSAVKIAPTIPFATSSGPVSAWFIAPTYKIISIIEPKDALSTAPNAKDVLAAMDVIATHRK